MSFGRAVQVWKITSLVLAGIYVVAALVGLLADWSTGQTAVWIAFLGTGGLLILIGQRLFRSSLPLSALLVSVGTAAGAFPLFFTFLVPLACAVVIALSVAIARQAPTAAA
jgi:hypothetical protein